MRSDSSAGVMVPKNIVPSAIRLTVNGPSVVVSMGLYGRASVSAIRSLCVYCGSNTGADPEFTAATRAMAALLAGRGIRVVYGGGAVGLMGVLADSALAEGGEVVGVSRVAVVVREIGDKGLRDLEVVGWMHERKALM